MQQSTLTTSQQQEAAHELARALFLSSLPASVQTALKIAERLEGSGRVKSLDRAA
jgi:hypothetical protein